MDWKFSVSSATEGGRGTVQERLVIRGDKTISPMEVFVREILQNALDAAIEKADGSRETVKAHFNFREIKGQAERDRLLHAAGWNKLKQHLKACESLKEQQMAPGVYDVDSLQRTPLAVLEYSESNTIGLVGREDVATLEQEVRKPGDPPKAFFALVRDDERQEKQGLGAGGTYGKGKAVLWAASASQTVLFYSRLSRPYCSRKTGEITYRGAGQARLHLHYLEGDKHSGVGHGGNVTAEGCWALRNDAAIKWAKELGISTRETGNDFGTTILLLHWLRPAPPADLDDEPDYKLTARFAAKYFWPAISDGRLVVTAKGSGNGTADASHFLGKYKPYIDLYQRLKKGIEEDDDVKPETINVTVPTFPAIGLNSEVKTKAVAAMSLVDEKAVWGDCCRAVACVRGQGMVIGYWAATRNKQVKPYVGLALAGRASAPDASGIYGDLLMGYAEGVTHTSWDKGAPNLSDWPDAKAPLYALLRSFEQYFEKNSAPDKPEVHEDLSALEEGLVFDGMDEGRKARKITGGPAVVTDGSLQRDGAHYSFSFNIRVDSDTSKSYVDLDVCAGLESGGAGAADRLEITLLSAPKQVVAEKLAGARDRRIRLHLPKVGGAHVFKISGKTNDLDSELMQITQAVLRVSPRSADECECSIPGAGAVAGEEG